MGNFKSELSNYQNVPRELVFDKNLSDRARFVYVFMACKPDGWDFYLEPMAKDIGYSVDTLRKYINELVTSGWLIKGKQTNENGVFGAVEYTLKATKKPDTEFFRHGNNQPQINKDIKEIKTEIKKDKDKSLSKKTTKDELFEECWLAYRRKGKKGKAYPYWKKLTDDEKQSVLPHIKAYVQAKELQYQQDFERYLRDKTFQSIVISRNTVVYDPTKFDSTKYTPQGRTIWFNEETKSYWSMDNFYYGVISDGYTDDNRPNGATITLNNGRGIIVWNSETKTWNKNNN
jgi:hypothetical protein